MPEPLHIEDFAAHLHSKFYLEMPFALELKLVQVNDLSNVQIEQFSLEFTGPETPSLQQGIYKLNHTEMGDQEIFLVPLGTGKGKTSYEAIFSRLIGKSTSKPMASA
jgi:hypothetical protein